MKKILSKLDIKNDILWRMYAVLGCIVLIALGILVKTAHIQIAEGEYWKSKRDSFHIDLRPVKAERGSILASDGSYLASSLPFYEIRMDTRAPSEEAFNKNIDTLAKCLFNELKGLSFATAEDLRGAIVQARESKNRYYLIARSVTHPQLQKLKSFPLFEKGPYEGGLIVNRQSKRSKPFGMLAHRTVGYITAQGDKVGLEQSFNDYLKGEEGKQIMQRVAGGAWIPLRDIADIEPKRGKDIVTTIDVNIQDIVGNALLKALKRHDAEHGCAVLMDVNTGAIKAIANIGKGADDDYWELYNYAVAESTEPGSTFKLATMMALLEDNLVDLNDTISLNKGKFEFYGDEMLDASIHGLDSTSVRRAFEVSSNVGMAKLTFENYERKGKREQFVKRLKQFHLHEKTGIPISGEGKPFLKSPDKVDDNWSGTTIPWMSIGYELQITPLQLLSFYSAVANGGKMMKPYLVSEIRQMGKTLQKFEPEVVDAQIASKRTIEKAQLLLEAVVQNGTAVSIKPETYGIAGKTGTAQRNYSKIKNEGRLKYQASFAGYFPTNKPKYACIIVISDPKEEGFYGGEVAAPVFKEIADKCYVKEIEVHNAINRRVKPKVTGRKLPVFSVGHQDDLKVALNYLDLPYMSKTTSKWAVIDMDSTKLYLKTRVELPKRIIPNVIGMGMRDAVYLMESQGVEVFVRGKGKVVSQSLPVGRSVRRGTRVYLVLN